MEDTNDFEFTDAHRVAATRAHSVGRVVVLDRGPAEPVASEATEGERTPAEIEADNDRLARLKREHADWHRLNDEPVPVVMHKIDAAHAVNADPERYLLVPPGARAPVTLEERVAKLEQRLGPETPEEIAHRRDRDARIAADRNEQDVAAHNERANPEGVE